MGYCKAHQLDMHGFCGRFDAPCIKKNCRFFGVETNADRIRAMSDDELAIEIKKIFIGKSPWCDHHCKLDDENSCSGCLLEWLKQPVGDDDG